MYGYLAHTKPISGEVAGSATAAQLPASLQSPCKRVVIRPHSGNGTHSVYVGFSSAVTVPNGSSDATTGFELVLGDPPLQLDIQHSNQIWYICSAATADFTITILT